jgi:predicted O-methyltransferase YrrM
LRRVTVDCVIPALQSPRVTRVIDAIREYAVIADADARARVAARTAELGRALSTAEKYDAYGDSPPLAISADAGELLYLLTRVRRPWRVVEFGASHGISTICIAAALRDLGAGSLVTTEIVPRKAEAAARNLADAGLGDVADVLAGDARETLRDVTGPIDLVFLDGRNDLYLAVLRLLEPHLGDGALVVADLSVDDPDLAPYLEHVRDPSGRYATFAFPLDAGLEISIWHS